MPSHGHAHGAGAHRYAARRHPEQVVLDIGGPFGALIVHTDPGMHGVEVEISATGDDDRRTHKEVLEREIDGCPVYTAVFDKVSAGTYTLWVDDVARERDVAVAAGVIAARDWSAAPPAQR